MLQFVMGALGQDKKQALIEQLLAIQAQDPQAQCFYLVPEHLKFDMESYLLQTLEERLGQEEAALLNIQVVSFKRLAWFLMPSDLAQDQPLSAVGQIMIVKRLLTQYQDQLKVFRGQVKHQGFAEKLLQLFDELYLGQIQPQDLLAVPQLHDLERARLSELSLLYQGFIEAIDGHVLGHYHELLRFNSYLKQHPLTRPTYLVVDHHYFFNGQQLQLLTTLIDQCQTVWVTLPLSSEQARRQDYDPLIELARHTYRQLRQLCQSLQLPLAEDWTIEQPIPGFAANMWTVAQAYVNQLQLAPDDLSEPLAPDQTTHHFWEHDAIQTEVRHTSNKIHQLVTQSGYRYRDILVVARDLDRYRPLVTAFFGQNEIPYFYDHEVSMGQHPFVLWLEAGLRLYRYRYQYADLFTILKSGLWLPPHLRQAAGQGGLTEPLEREFQAQVDLLENIVLANGYVGYRFEDLAFEWRFDEADRPYVDAQGQVTEQTYAQVADQLRRAIIADFAPYQALSQQGAFTGQAAAEWLYQWLDGVGVKDRLMQRRDQAIAAGDLAQSRQYEQVWQTLMSSLDEFYQLYGQAELTFAELQELVMTGLNEATFHIIPPALDQVMVTSMDSPQVQPYKICFILGADETTLPRAQREDSLLTPAYRQALAQGLLPYQQLAQSSQQIYSLELLMVQQLLLNAQDQLFISYVAMKGQQSVKLSPYFNQLAKQFHFPIETQTHSLIQDGQPRLSPLEFGRYPVQMSPLLQLVHHYAQSGTRPSPAFRDFLSLMAERQPATWTLLDQVFRFSPLPENLTPETALALFGRRMTASVSKLEQYFQDPYSHFLLYGLKIQPRRQMELGPAGAGDYYHDFLDQFTQAYAQNPDLEATFQAIQALLEAEVRFNIFDTNPRMRLIRRKLDAQLKHFLTVSVSQSQGLTVQPIATELVFGSQAEPGLVLPLQHGSLTLRGKIDRIDADPSRHFYQVIDYKSGKKDFSLVDFYYGLDLQVLTYLQVASQRFPGGQPVGAFYQSLASPFVKVDQKQLQRLSQEGLESASQQTHKYKGLMTLPGSELVRVEPALLEQTKSQVYPVQLKKDGSYYQTVLAVSKPQLTLINDYLTQLMTRAGEAIQAGEIALSPFKDERFTPSLQAEFRVITGFDATVHHQVYRHKHLSKDQVLTQIEADLGRPSDVAGEETRDHDTTR